jgi:hypothetical protein
MGGVIPRQILGAEKDRAVRSALDEMIIVDKKGFEKKVKAGIQNAIEAQRRGLAPTPYFFEALDYVRKARILQNASLINGGLGIKPPKVGDPLMEHIPIYNTVRRRYAGFSNVLEQLWYARSAPKYKANIERKFVIRDLRPWRTMVKELPSVYGPHWLYVCLAHRITGSGASFEWDHGWRNNRISHACAYGDIEHMAKYLAEFDGPIFTSIGNQIPPFPKCGGREYLRTIAPKLAVQVYDWLADRHREGAPPAGIKETVDMVLFLHTQLGCRQFKFVLTAWVMDMAEYLPHLVDPHSDCYHGKNAIEAIEICFEVNMKRQALYDTATRLFADISGTYPMDVEDASPGCDLVRWIENYVPKKGFEHVIEKGIFNGSSLTWPNGRQPDPF